MKNPLVWYSNALEVLSPLRYHLDEVLNEMEAYNRFLKHMGDKATVGESKIKEARKAQKIAEEFFCGKTD